MKTKEIQAIENKYGMMIFRMAFTHLMDVGHRHMSDPEMVSESCKTIRETTSDNSFMTADFQCSLMECAAELTQFSIDDLLRYVKTDFMFDGLTMGGEETKWKSYLCNLVYSLIEEKGSEEAFEFVRDACGVSPEKLREIGVEVY